MRVSFVQIMTGLLLLTLLVAGAPADTRLSVAAMNGDTTAVQALLNEGVDINAAQGDGTTALHWAASRDDLAMTQLLLKAKADVNAKTRLNEMTPLLMAARAGNGRIVDALLKAGADVKSTSTVGTTALMFAAASGNVEAVQALIKAGAEVNAKDNTQGQTAAMFAAANGRADVIRILAAGKADLNARSNVPTRMSKTVGQTFTPVVNGAANQANPATLGGRGGRGGRGAAADKPLAVGGMSAMQFAAREGHIDTVRALVESGADVNVQTTSDQMTTLTLAVVNGRYDIAKYLIERGADPKPASAEEATALFTTLDVRWAPLGWYPSPQVDNERVDYLQLMSLLLDKGADVNARMNGRMWMRIVGPGGGPVYTGETPFLRAAQANDLDAMKLLLARGANPSIATSKGINALMLAAGTGHRPSEGHVKPDSRLATVRYLVEELGFDPNWKDDDGFTSLHGAASVGDKDVITYLFSRGADVKARANVLLERNANGKPIKPGSGETIADMANGPAEKTLVYPDVIKMLVDMGSEFSDNCRAALCVNKPRESAPPATPATKPPEPKKPESSDPVAPKKPGGR
jgi:uncharacterized protein